MNIGALSPTKIESMRQCMARLAARYGVDSNEYEEEQGEPALAGTLAHCAAKVWYRNRDVNGNPVATPDEAFKAAIEECFHEKDRQGNPNPQVPKTPSMLQDSREMFDAIIAVYKRDEIKVVFAERKYDMQIAGIPIRLIIDLGLDVGNGVLEIVDYKTGFLTVSDDEMWDKDQVLLNLLATMYDADLRQFATKRFRYFWTRKGFVSGDVYLSWEQLTDYQKLLALDYQRILDTTEPEETINRFCKSCGRRDECKAYGEYLAEIYGAEKIEDVKLLTPEDIAKLSDDEIMARYDRLKSQYDLLEANRKKLGDHIKSKLQNASEYEGQRFKASMRQNRSTDFAAETVVQLATKYGKNVATLMSPSPKKVQAAFGAIPEALAALNQTAIHGASSAYVSIGNVTNRNTRKKPKAPKAP